MSSDRAQIPLILESMAEGYSLRKSCEATGVSLSTFLLWVKGDKELADQYARARVSMLDTRAEQLEDIGAQAASADSAVTVAGLRLQSDNRKWLLSKLAAKKYGDKLELSGDADNPLITRIERVIVPATK